MWIWKGFQVGFSVNSKKSLCAAFPNYGSVLWVLIHLVLPVGPAGSGRTPADNSAVIWKVIQRFYDELKSEDKYWVIRMNMFTTGSQPKMKGKAAEVKDLAPFLIKSL